MKGPDVASPGLYGFGGVNVGPLGLKGRYCLLWAHPDFMGLHRVTNGFTGS